MGSRCHFSFQQDDGISHADSAHDLNDFLSSLDQGAMRSVLSNARVGSGHASSGGSSPSSAPSRASVSGKGERAVSRVGKQLATPGAKGRLSVASKVPVAVQVSAGSRRWGNAVEVRQGITSS